MDLDRSIHWMGNCIKVLLDKLSGHTVFRHTGQGGGCIQSKTIGRLRAEEIEFCRAL